MSTRGLIGVRINGKDKLSYNHSDSYPTYLGKYFYEQCLQLIKEEGWDKIKQLAENLKQVDGESKPSKKDSQLYSMYFENVNNGEGYYALLRGLQGELIESLKVGISIEYNSFINDSLMCEWVYILNVDEKTMEIYKGYQTKKHNKGRYTKKLKGDKFYPCALVKTIPLTDDIDIMYNNLSINWKEIEQLEEA